MPTYDFICTACKHEFEAILRIAEREEYTQNGKCPKCGKQKLKRRVTTTSFSMDGAKDIFHRAGDGWKEVQDKIKAGSGKGNTIRTK